MEAGATIEMEVEADTMETTNTEPLDLSNWQNVVVLV